MKFGSLEDQIISCEDVVDAVDDGKESRRKELFFIDVWSTKKPKVVVDGLQDFPLVRQLDNDRYPSAVSHLQSMS